MKRSTSKKADKIAKREELIKEAYRNYINLSRTFIDKALKSKLILTGQEGNNIVSLLIMEAFIVHANKQIDQIERSIFKGEKISHKEKVFSLFEDHTEWISKGKAGVSQELCLRVSIVKDQHGFILYHHVIENQTDEQVTVLLVEEANEIEHAKEFKAARTRHSSGESSIHALLHGGFRFCPDHGIKGFKRYIAFSALSRNIQTLGTIIQKKQLKSLKKQLEQESKAA